MTQPSEPIDPKKLRMDTDNPFLNLLVFVTKIQETAFKHQKLLEQIVFMMPVSPEKEKLMNDLIQIKKDMVVLNYTPTKAQGEK